MGDVDDEIRKAQQERLKLSKASFSAKSVSYDEDIYGASGRVSTSEYNTELDDDEAPSINITGKASRYSTESREVVRRALSSYTAPKHLLESRPKADAKEDIDNPFQEFKRKTVAEREDEYRARWRKRKLSPPRVAAFGKDAAPEGARSYREIMIEQQLEKEKKEILRKIQKKKEEEEENRKRELKDRNHGTLWDVKEEGVERSEAPSRNNRASASSGSSSNSGNWVINIVKNSQRVGDPIVLNPQTTPTFSIGRDRASHLALDHPSCSKQHASISFKGNVPHITDLGSTNGTIVNDDQIGAHRAIPIKAGDVIKFGGSTREYTLFQQ